MEVKAAEEGKMVLWPLVGLAWRSDWLWEPELQSSRQRLGSRRGLFQAEVLPPPACPQEPYNVASEPAFQYVSVSKQPGLAH